ncbi:hypothetical protein PIB30_058187 [Stylosanthes scabra]|uniref:Putative plant transposon protein domain-containing protein n=1 Tax=Stylosanthes scabra TaxID=79078 RepID=A0ABU6WLK2_9FABA|nr:hypothetical protein [Stylosanthes scabra]
MRKFMLYVTTLTLLSTLQSRLDLAKPSPKRGHTHTLTFALALLHLHGFPYLTPSPLPCILSLNTSHLLNQHQYSPVHPFPHPLTFNVPPTRVRLPSLPTIPLSPTGASLRSSRPASSTNIHHYACHLPTRVTKAMHKLIPSRLQPSSFLVFLEPSIRDSHASFLYTHMHILTTHPMHLSHPSTASSSDALRKRRGKAVVVDEDTFDAHRFKTPFHEHFFNSNRLNKPKKRISQTIIREFFANARIDPNNEVGPRFHTFVRSMLVNFSMDRIKTIMKFEGPLNSETSYRARMVEGNQDLDAVTRDICEEGAVWSLGARNNPLYLKRSDLNTVARGWHEFIIHNIMPTTNQSEVTLNRAVLIHCIMSSQEVSVEKIIVDAMMNIINKLHTSKPPHPPVQPFNPQQHHHHEQLADGYGWGQLQEDMANMSKNQTEFYDSMLAQQTAYGLRLQEMETRQQEMWQFQQEAWQEQEKMQKELTNYKKNFSSHMEKLHAAHEEQKTKMGQTNQVLVNHALDSQAGNMYTHWALQQANQNLVPMIPTKIPPAIRENFKAGRPLFHGMLHPWPPEGSSNALGQQTTPAVDVP